MSGRWLISSLVALVVASASVEASGLALKLSCERSTVVRYEPIVVDYVVENTGHEAALVPGYLESSGGAVRFEVAREGAAFRAFRTGPSERVAAKDRLLRAGERVGSHVLMLTNALPLVAPVTPEEIAGAGLYPFAEPGRYVIRATLVLDDDHAVTSNPVSIVVTDEPNEQAALRFFSDLRDFAGAVGADADIADLAASASRWEAFVSAHPRSVYAPFVLRHLAMLYLSGTPGLQADHEKTRRFATMLGKVGPPALKAEALRIIAQCQAPAE